MFAIVVPNTSPMNMDDVPEEYRLQTMTQNIQALRREREVLQQEADIAADDARVMLARAQDAQNALQENADEIKVLKTKAANLRLDQAEAGLKWQQDRVDKYQEAVDALPPLPKDDSSDSSDDEDDGSDPPAPAPAPTPSVQRFDVWNTTDGVNCANVPNSFVISSRAYSKEEGGVMGCIRECQERADDPNEMFRCSHVAWNKQSNVCTQFASLDQNNPSTIDVSNAQVCVRNPDVNTSIAPGVPCLGCKR